MQPRSSDGARAIAPGAPQPDAQRADSADAARRLLLVTGMSGAGKSTALKALEDLGFEAVDNLPLTLLGPLIRQRPREAVAVGIDIRTREFGVDAVLAEMDALLAESDVAAELLFLDCDDEAIARRYTETRRRHPLAQDRTLIDGVRHERQLVQPLRDKADEVIDTTLLSAHDLKRVLQGRFQLDRAPTLAIFVTSFSYRRGLPREADLVFDVRFLKNPYYAPELKDLTGRDAPVGEHVAADPGFEPFYRSLTDLLGLLLPRYESEGKSYLTVAFGCTGGRHRSVYLAERIGDWLRRRGGRVQVAHRDIAGAEPERPPPGSTQAARKDGA